MKTFNDDQLKTRASELGIELTPAQLADSNVRKFIASTIGKEKVDTNGGGAAQFPEETPTGEFVNDEAQYTGKAVLIKYTDDDGVYSPFYLLDVNLTPEAGQTFHGSASMSPIQYLATLPQPQNAVPIKVRDNRRASVIVK